MSRTPYILLFLAPALSVGCGLGDTAATAAAGGTSKAQELAEARKVQQRVQQQIDRSALQAGDRLRAAEAASQ